jgi:hypothetical protein
MQDSSVLLGSHVCERESFQGEGWEAWDIMRGMTIDVTELCSTITTPQAVGGGDDSSIALPREELICLTAPRVATWLLES